MGVIDLHDAQGMIRIIEGVSDLSSFPGYEPGSTRRSFQKLCSLLSIWLEGIVIVPQQTFHVRDDGRVEMHKDAWKEWETHSRSCRYLFSLF